MTNILVEHAKEHVWQEPEQDYQFNIGLGRLTKTGGFVGSASVLWHRVLSPTRNEPTRKFHHLYQIGQISPITLNLVAALVKDRWVPVEQIVDDFDLLIEVYFESGGVVPLDHIWIMRDFTDNLLLCIWHDRKIDYGELTFVSDYNDVVSNQKVTLDSDKLITRFYSNAQQSNLAFNQASGVNQDSIKTVSMRINSINDYNSLVTKVAAIRELFKNKGMALWYADGFLVNTPGAYHSDMAGKEYRMVWDETFKSRQLFPMKDIPIFTSELDRNRKKYLLLADSSYTTIDYYDDVDFYLVAGNELEFKGIYINRAFEHSIRQITHNAWALDAETIKWYMRHHNFLADENKVFVLVQARIGGMSRGVFAQGNRINELFRLPYDLILNAFRNTDSLVQEWRATNLENSDYIHLMGAMNHEITPELVTDAYGYPGISETVANPVRKVISGRVMVPEALLLLDKRTQAGVRSVFCYDAQGRYLGFVNNSDTNAFIDVSKRFPTASDAECFRMECIVNSQFAGIYYNKDVVSYDLAEFGFSAYICSEVNGIANEEWDDVTGTPFYTFDPGDKKTPPTFRWNWDFLSSTNSVGCVRINKYILTNTFKFYQKDYKGYVAFNLSALHDWNGNYEVRKLTLPPAVVELFVDGDQLIQGIDFYMNFPLIVINNSQVLSKPDVTITVRSYGSGNPYTGEPYPPTEVGFVTEGLLSLNGHYDITKNRTNKVVINSRLVDKSKVRFSEYALSGGLYPVDGRPYMIQDYVVNVEPFATTPTNRLYNEMVDRDKRFGDYLGQFLPEPVVTMPVVATDRWSLVSPLISTILYQFASGRLGDDFIGDEMSIDDINYWLSSVLWLLEYDPAYIGVDDRYVHIKPHPYAEPVTCTSKQYRLLEFVIKSYLFDRVDLTSFVKIG